jgi:uncharacterized protein YjdB
VKKILVGLVAAGAIIAACSSTVTTSTPVVASVTMVPVAHRMHLGDTATWRFDPFQLAAVLKDAGGNVLSVIQTGQTVDWTSSAPSVATVNQFGRVTAVAVGSATITAAIESKSGTSDIPVTALSLVSENVSPAIDSVNVGSTRQLKAWPIDVTGDTLVPKKTKWTSSDTLVAKVTNTDSLGLATGTTGVIRGIAAGTVTITATVAGVSGTGSMKVKP